MRMKAEEVRPLTLTAAVGASTFVCVVLVNLLAVPLKITAVGEAREQAA